GGLGGGGGWAVGGGGGGWNAKTRKDAAGRGIEPAPSVPSAAGTRPAATAAALPPLDPPADRSRSQGLRVGPRLADSVKGHWASSAIRVVPITTAPAASSSCTAAADC